jgi:Flp pilus assembly pilin Flp
MLAALSRYWRCWVGATAIEYALIAALVVLVLAPGLLWLRNRQEELSQKLNAQLDPAAAAAMIDARRDFREPPRAARDRLP